MSHLESSAAQAHPGTVVGKRYRLESLLGEGGMAVVWKATHTETDRLVALKLVRANLVENEQARELFVREAKIAARVGRSEHIVDVLDAGIDEVLRVPFLAMELLEGEPLDVHLRRVGPLHHPLAAQLFLQLGEALDQAHAVGVVHRDLKPQNLFLSKGRKGSPILKVLDFGIAKVAEASQQSSTQIGTPAYAAPEQLGPSWRAIAEGRGKTIASTVSPQTDVWAMGLVVFEALTGARSGDLWGATTLAELPLKVVLEPTPMASTRTGDRPNLLPPGFDAWLLRCLDVDATRRFPSAGEAIAALVLLLEASPQLARVAPTPVAATVLPGGWGEPQPPWQPRHAASVAGPPAVGPSAGGPQGGAWPMAVPTWPVPQQPSAPPHFQQGYAPGSMPGQQGFHVTTGANWAGAPPDPQLAAWVQARRLDTVMADVQALRALGPWVFIPPLLSAGREARGSIGEATFSLVEMTRGDAVGRATGDDRTVLALVRTPRSQARAAVRSRQSAGFADNVARSLKLIDSLVGAPSTSAVSIGDPLLESHFEIGAPSAHEGHAALTPALRTYLVHQRFRGTLELRAGLFAVMHFDVARFEPRALDYMLSVVSAIVAALP